MDKIVVYTDGSALDNGSKTSGCGWACKLMYAGHEVMHSGRAIGKTNNQMEMQAVLEAMRSITDKSFPVEVFSDSEYVVKTMNGIYQIKKNEQLWATLMKEKNRFTNITFTWVKGHDKNRHNIDVDRQANEEAKQAYEEIK